MVGPPNLDKLIQFLASEAKRYKCTMTQAYANLNIFRIPTLGSRDALVQSHGWNAALVFGCAERSGCSEFTKFATQEFEKVYNANQVGDVQFFNPTEKSLQISCLWLDQ